LGRFVVPGLTVSDRARVLAAYAAGRGLSRRAHRRLARWLVTKTIARRCAIDRIPAAAASTRRRSDEARARHPRAPGSRRHAARPPHARRRGPAPRLGAPLRARRPASAGGGGGARRRARHLPAGAPALAGLAGAARAAGGRAPP